MANSAVSAVPEQIFDAYIAHAEALRWHDVPSATRHLVKRELLDYWGAALAGRAAVGMPTWVQVLTDFGGRADARVLGGPAVPAPTAALANGYFGHVLEFDDTHDEAVLHAGSTAIPAALAVATMRGAAGKPVSGVEFCEAVLMGIEVTCRLGVATRLNLVDGGWIYTALIGHFGATLAAALLVDKRPDTIRNALGIVYCLTCGNHQSTREGAPTKHVQPGFAASNAVTATLMASGGLKGVKQALTGEDGLARVYLRDQFDTTRAVADLGRVYEFDRLSIKPYPTCRLTHPAISAALELRAQLGADVDKIEHVELVMGPQAHDVVGRDIAERRTPQSRVAAQFSVYWTVAIALAYGEVTPGQLAEEIPPSPKVQAWIDKITGTPDASTSRDIGGCTVRARGAFGQREVQHLNAKGHPDYPLTDEELLEKFHANLRYAKVPLAEAKRLAQMILEIDGLDDVRALSEALANAVSS